VSPGGRGVLYLGGRGVLYLGGRGVLYLGGRGVLWGTWCPLFRGTWCPLFRGTWCPQGDVVSSGGRGVLVRTWCPRLHIVVSAQIRVEAAAVTGSGGADGRERHVRMRLYAPKARDTSRIELSRLYAHEPPPRCTRSRSRVLENLYENIHLFMQSLQKISTHSLGPHWHQ
jgi:hypothetical protein